MLATFQHKIALYIAKAKQTLFSVFFALFSSAMDAQPGFFCRE
jgi:hypothetical protein